MGFVSLSGWVSGSLWVGELAMLLEKRGSSFWFRGERWESGNKGPLPVGEVVVSVLGCEDVGGGDKMRRGNQADDGVDDDEGLGTLNVPIASSAWISWISIRSSEG